MNLNRNQNKKDNIRLIPYYAEFINYVNELNFLHEDQRTIFENVEKKSDIEFVKPGKTFKIFMNEAKKHNLSDTDLLHVLLFMKIVYNKSYSIEDFPLLIKSDDIIINPLFI